MNAYELADELQELDSRLHLIDLFKSANMLRQQADRIAELEKQLSQPMQILNDGRIVPVFKELSDEEIKLLLDRIQNYLECGGFFNPECMEHDKVRDLIMDCRAILKKASE